MQLNSYKIVIIGPGALGCLFATRLAALKMHQVWILDRNQDRADLIDRRGIVVTADDSPASHIPIHATTDATSIGPVDLMLLCVKSYDVATTLAQSRPLFKANSLLIALQNGILHLPFLTSAESPGYFAAGVTAMGATSTGTGEIRFGGSGATQIGFLKPQKNDADQRLNDAAHILTSAGITTQIETDIVKNIWSKLMINVGINALTAIYDCRNGVLLETPEAKHILSKAVIEAQNVARSLGINFDHDPVEKTYAVCRATAQNTSSMLQDIRKNRPTEIDAINGAVVAEAQRRGLTAPTNEELVRKVKEMERGQKNNLS